MRVLRVFSLLAMLAIIAVGARAQNVALKTNLLYDATATPNLGLEVGMGQHHSLQLYYGLNPWHGDGDEDRYAKHWLLMPEYRYWFCQNFNGWFLGINAMGGEFKVNNVAAPKIGWFSEDVFLKHRMENGWYVGGGISAGYQWILGKHWNLEASLGVGYDYIHYSRYNCGHCGTKDRDGHAHYVGLNKAALALLYIF